MAWNFDMDAAPHGRVEQRTRKVKDADVPYEHFVRDRIIVAADDGKTVTMSSWLPEEGRWEMFTKDHPPIAWQLWPEHPGAQS